MKKGAGTASSPYGLCKILLCGDEAVPAPLLLAFLDPYCAWGLPTATLP